MKKKPSELTRLYHMLNAIDDVQKFVEGVTYEEYMNDYMRRLALVKLLEIIGEASGHV